VSKIADHRDEIVRTETLLCDEDDLDTLLIAYGFTARSAYRAAQELRRRGTPRRAVAPGHALALCR
jgi:pyruvate/2-oxoacid:ferredoxin oxidoreductase alpha subunit